MGGKRKILMQNLKLLFVELGFQNVSTYIQSGNVFFDSDKKLSDIETAKKIEQAIFEKFGFEVPVIVRSGKELENAIESNPFYQSKEAEINSLYLTFLKEVPIQEYITRVELDNYEPDKFEIEENHVFVFCEGKYNQTKLNNNFFEKKLKTQATTRNWKTVLKLLELSE